MFKSGKIYVKIYTCYLLPQLGRIVKAAAPNGHPAGHDDRQYIAAEIETEEKIKRR